MITFEEFIQKIENLPAPVIMLAGKREVLARDEKKLTTLGEILARNLPACKFRSGNAKGSDELFIKGVCNVNPELVELILPFSGHRKKAAQDLYTLSLDNFDLVAEPEAVYQTRKLTGASMVDSYMKGIRNKITIKASYLIRDNIMVIGSPKMGLEKIAYGIFYDDPANPMQGGTGHTMRICRLNDVPFVTQKTWMEWLNQENNKSNPQDAKPQ